MQIPSSLITLGVFSTLLALTFVVGRPPAPPLPVWPEQFTSDFSVHVGIYGSKWNSTGKIFY